MVGHLVGGADVRVGPLLAGMPENRMRRDRSVARDRLAPARTPARSGAARPRCSVLGCPGAGADYTEACASGMDCDVHMSPRHISSEDPSPQVMKCGGTRRRIGSCWASVGV